MVVQQGGKINATGSRPPVVPLVDEERRRRRSESWILTDAHHGLLILKYNNGPIEHSAISWNAEQNRPVFAWSAFVSHKEPVQANARQSGTSFTFDEMRYEFYDVPSTPLAKRDQPRTRPLNFDTHPQPARTSSI